ncbi:MAG TPA: hypothetical protein VGO13_07320 [Solirubrobacterales bacterium]|jgi:hypothetical protein|nr:hypothetical protein [Solirubrobacterales bacterium]
MPNIIPILIFAAILAPLVFGVGCGEDSGSVDVAGGQTLAPVTKAKFIQHADEICSLADKKQEEALQAFQQKNPETSSRDWEESAVFNAGLPVIQVEVEKLAALSPPRDNAKVVKVIFRGIKEAVEEVQVQPSSILIEGSAEPFTGVARVAREYGFKACGVPF